jgi:hypothetical protein
VAAHVTDREPLRDWRFWVAIALVILGYLGWRIYDYNFGPHIHANALVNNPNQIVGSSYTAFLNVHMGGPVDVKCDVGAFTTEGRSVAHDTFILRLVDGHLTHVGTLTHNAALDLLFPRASVSPSIQEGLQIQCRQI